MSLHPDDLLITPNLYTRPARPDDLAAELKAFRELSSMMEVSPETAILRFLDLALELCPNAGSAGLSELATNDNGEPVFCWTALRGAFAGHVGGSTPRDFSPCGLCLDQHHTILVERPARVFTYFKGAEPEIVECLVVPLYDTGKRALGTIWVVSHDPDSGFDATDARIMEQLAIQLVLALKLRRKAQIVAELEQAAREKETLLEEVHHRVKNTIQMASSLLVVQANAAGSEAEKAVLHEAQSRLMVLAKVHEALQQPPRSDGARQVDLSSLIETLCVSHQASLGKAADVEIRHKCDAVLVGSDQAIPIGLIVNEAVTNALKHAFPKGGKGRIDVDLWAGEAVLKLCISDNGKGFGGPLRKGSLGFRLIKTLARQLGATLDIVTDQGTAIQLSMPLSSARPKRLRAAVDRHQDAQPVG